MNLRRISISNWYYTGIGVVLCSKPKIKDKHFISNESNENELDDIDD